MVVGLVINLEVARAVEGAARYAQGRNRIRGFAEPMEAVGLVRQRPSEPAPVPNPWLRIEQESPGKLPGLFSLE